MTRYTRGVNTKSRKSGRRRYERDPVGIRAGRPEAGDLEALKPADAGLHRGRAPTLEHVDAEVVVIPVPAHEPHHATGLRHQLHAHGFIKGLRAVQVGDVEVHVTQHRAARELFLRRVRDSQQPLEIQAVSYTHLTLPTI